MLFGSKKTKNAELKKEKLSVIALDHFVEAYKSDSEKPDPKSVLPYVTSNKEIIYLDLNKIRKGYKKSSRTIYIFTWSNTSFSPT